MKRLYSLAILMLTAVGTIFGANVKVEMNNESTTMTLAKKGSTENVEVGEPEKTSTHSLPNLVCTFLLVLPVMVIRTVRLN